MSILQKVSYNGTNPSYMSTWYWADTLFSAQITEGNRTKITSPNAIQVDVGGISLTQYSAQTIDISVATNWDDYANDADWDGTNYSTAANRAGLDFYLYAVAPVEGSIPRLLVSANSTYPIGYATNTSRKIAGFHCLCLSVGTISGHTLTGYVTGDILPATVWDLKHKSASLYGNIGQFYEPAYQEWWAIYPLSGTLSAPTIIKGGTILSGTGVDWNGAVDAGKVLGMRLPRDANFQIAAAGSNEETNIVSSVQPSPFTSIGYSDTAGRRMISNLGMESACGLIWQWLDEQTYRFDGATAHTHQTTTTGDAGTFTSGNASADVAPAWAYYDLPGSKGSLYKQGTYGDAKLLAGSGWNAGANCGSRCRALYYYR
jgi:hypothetical protein